MTTKTFGPVIWQSDEGDISTLCTRCTVSDLRCAFLVGNVCTAHTPSRHIPNAEDTPDWCPHRGQAEADMREIKGAPQRPGLLNM
ncbi:hypothetical protein [Sediminimonas sp.]|uniref:hypothetical protein n=1 Tax=Sediminimonas sp. TaxID=2823379 RepID=UPI0025E6931B|nr:hypothetical protein [Sediminimonas sp.]